MPEAKDFTVKRIGEDEFELWHDEKFLITMTKEEAYPVMLGRVHPREVVDESTLLQESNGNE
jgi:hypothetical protein